ncbi:hypothetical protein IKQ02_04210 [bacterium]|nr:hypothetical protein [bacterium]
MYLWFAVSVDDYYKELKEKAFKVNDELGIEFGAFNLPYHISLKISFEVEDIHAKKIINTAIEFFKTLKPFTVNSSYMENNGTILWIRYQDNEYLKYIGSTLNKILNEKYSIPYHEYDLDFIYHTTIFMNDDKSLINKGYERLKDFELPKELYINKFLIGSSEDGLPHTFKVIKEIKIDK